MRTSDDAATFGEPVARAAHPLEVLLRPLWDVSIEDGPASTRGDDGRIVCRAGDGAPTWLRSGSWRLYARPSSEADVHSGATLQTFRVEGGGQVEARHEARGDVVVPFSLAETYSSYVFEKWQRASGRFTLSKRQLDLFYRVKRLIPRSLQLAARRALIRAQGPPGFPAWPLDTSVDQLVRFFARCALRASGRQSGQFVWFWPHGAGAAVVLTHDVEGEAGITLALELADLEEELGFRSSFNFGGWYDVDPGVLRELTARGFEIGMHGLTHDRALFSSREAFEARLPALEELAARLGAVGFRSPATHRVVEWLAELPIAYDCTVPNSDPYEPQPGGCGSVWPFFVGPVVELPYTLPQDHTLLTLLRHGSPALWLDQAQEIERIHGLVQCVSHPDSGYLGDADKRAVYAEFLRGLAERDNLWRALPRDVAVWWRQRAACDAADERFQRGRVHVDEPSSSVLIEAPAARTGPR